MTVKIFKYFSENNLFYGYLIKDIPTGIKVLKEVFINGYRPSVARVYSEEDARQHFYHFHEGKCVLIFMAEGAKPIADACGQGIEEAVEKFKDGIIKKVDSSLIEDWFNHLNWSQKDIDDEVQEMINNDRHSGYTTEISANWETIPKIYENVINRIRTEFKQADDLVMLSGHLL